LADYAETLKKNKYRQEYKGTKPRAPPQQKRNKHPREKGPSRLAHAFDPMQWSVKAVTQEAFFNVLKDHKMRCVRSVLREKQDRDPR
jgi:hypothetical protein